MTYFKALFLALPCFVVASALAPHPSLSSDNYIVLLDKLR